MHSLDFAPVPSSGLTNVSVHQDSEGSDSSTDEDDFVGPLASPRLLSGSNAPGREPNTGNVLQMDTGGLLATGSGDKRVAVYRLYKPAQAISRSI